MSYEGVYDFYVGRISSCPLYGFRAGCDLLCLVLRCARYDWECSLLTDDEINSIINMAEKCHNRMMEDNYNEGWNENPQR